MEASLRFGAVVAFTAVVGVAGLAVGSAPAVARSAAPVVTPSGGAPGSGTVVGDFTGDGIRDAVSLRQTTGADGQLVCLADLKVGAGGGAPASQSRIRLPVRGANNRNAPSCPPVAQALGTPGADQLAVSGGAGWPSYFGPVLQVFDLSTGTTARYAGGFTGQFNPPSTIRVTDFDGDGYDDFYQQGTDQGDGVDLFVRRGDTWPRFYGSGYTPRGDVTLADLDRGLGADAIVTAWSNSINQPTVTVVDGRTGRTQNLVTGDYYGTPGVDGYLVEVVDINGDAYPDIAVTPHVDSGTPVARYFVNRSQNGAWKFVETRQRPVTT